MKNLFLTILFLNLLFSGNAYADEERTVEKSDINVAWKVDGKFIKPECFDYIKASGDYYETYYDAYFKKPTGSHRDDPNYVKFTEEVGNYLNKEVPLNHFVDTGWPWNPKISLTTQLEGCLTEKPETYVMIRGDDVSNHGYKVLHTFDPTIAKKLAPYIDKKFESVKQVEVLNWGGGSIPTQGYMVVYGVLELEGKKVLLPLRNKSILTEIGKRDSFFEPTGRYSYEAEFDLNDNITEIIDINDFKQMVSSDGCFKISDFKKDGKIYDFLKRNNLKKYCNKVRPFDDIDWALNQKEFKTVLELYSDSEYRFTNLIRSKVSNLQVPWEDKEPQTIAEELLNSINHYRNQTDIKYLDDGKQVVVSGCMQSYCSQKGFVFIYRDNIIGLIRHTGYEKVSNEEDFLIFSKTHKSFDEIPKVFVQSVQDWIDELGLDSIVTINTKSKKGWLGVRLKNVTKEIADVEKLKNIEGALVSGVGKASPAEKAGLKAGDIILKFDGSKIDMMSALPKIVSRTEVGKSVELEIWRNKKLVIKKLILGRIRLPETKVRFIGSDNTIKEVKNLFKNASKN